jgi:hypothetical protein
LNILLATLERLISTDEVFAEKLSFYTRENLSVILSVTTISHLVWPKSLWVITTIWNQLSEFQDIFCFLLLFGICWVSLNKYSPLGD